MNLLVLLLTALPMCIAQFSIQGPSDGNRVAQGLTVEEGKGIRYTDQNDSPDGGFTIQGASDGHSNVQGASDGHSDFHIQGASDLGANRYNFQAASTGAYNIQGSSDGHSQPQSIIRGSYDPSSSSKSLQYNDPSGSRVSWRSYDRQSLPGPQQAHYSEAAVSASAPRGRQGAHAPRQPQPQPQPEPIPALDVQNVNAAPAYIKQLLQFQAQIPYMNIIPDPFRHDAVVTTQQHSNSPQVQYQREEVPEPRRPAHRGKPRGPPRHRRQAAPQQNHRPSQPPAEPQYRYSPNLPPQFQDLLKFQAQTPYINAIPEQFRFNPEPAIKEQLRQVQSYYQDLLSRQPTQPVVEAATFGRESTRPEAPEPEPEHSRQRRQAPHQPRPQPQRQQLPAEPQLQYSTNLPDNLRSLLKYQAQIPYNIIANQITYRLDKPYVPEPVQSSAPSQQAQYQSQYQPQPSEYQPQQAHQPQQAQYQSQYQSQSDQYQGQPSDYQYSSQTQYPDYSQGQAGYQQTRNEVRPVTEKQY